jgi:hypothetical protein
MGQGENLAVIVDCILEDDGRSLLAFVLKFKAEAFDVLLNKGLLWLNLHECSSVPL